MLMLNRTTKGGDVAVNPAHVASVAAMKDGTSSCVRLSDGFEFEVVQGLEEILDGLHREHLRCEGTAAQARYEASIQTFKRNIGDFKDLLRETMAGDPGPIVNYASIGEPINPPADPLPQGETAPTGNTTPAGESSPT